MGKEKINHEARYYNQRMAILIEKECPDNARRLVSNLREKHNIGLRLPKYNKWGDCRTNMEICGYSSGTTVAYKSYHKLEDTRRIYESMLKYGPMNTLLGEVNWQLGEMTKEVEEYRKNLSKFLINQVRCD